MIDCLANVCAALTFSYKMYSDVEIDECRFCVSVLTFTSWTLQCQSLGLVVLVSVAD